MMALIYTTLPDKKSAIALGELLLNNQLICCSNIFPVTSQYFWEGKLNTDEEYAAYFKTILSNIKPAVECIEENHPYDVPLIASREINMNDSYKQWANELLR